MKYQLLQISAKRCCKKGSKLFLAQGVVKLEREDMVECFRGVIYLCNTM